MIRFLFPGSVLVYLALLVIAYIALGFTGIIIVCLFGICLRR